MLLLGLTLAVGFYEGRQLVQNTAKAFRTADRVTAAADRRARRSPEPAPARARLEHLEALPTPLVSPLLDEEGDARPVGRKGRKARRQEKADRLRRRHERFQRLQPTHLDLRAAQGRVTPMGEPVEVNAPATLGRLGVTGEAGPARRAPGIRVPTPQAGLGALDHEGGINDTGGYP